LGITRQRVHQLIEVGRIVLYGAPGLEYVNVDASNRLLEDTVSTMNETKRRRFRPNRVSL
jgi:hypothetical protein